MPIICDECGERAANYWVCYCQRCEDQHAQDLEDYEKAAEHEAELDEENEILHDRIEELEQELKNK
jgi:hypothetical protein